MFFLFFVFLNGCVINSYVNQQSLVETGWFDVTTAKTWNLRYFLPVFTPQKKNNVWSHYCVTWPKWRALKGKYNYRVTLIHKNASVKKVETVASCTYYKNSFFSVTSTAGTMSSFVLSMSNDKAVTFCMASSSSSNWKICIHDFYTKKERLLSRSFTKTLTNIRK